MTYTKESCNTACVLDILGQKGTASSKEEQVAGFLISPVKEPATASGPIVVVLCASVQQ